MLTYLDRQDDLDLWSDDLRRVFASPTSNSASCWPPSAGPTRWRRSVRATWPTVFSVRLVFMRWRWAFGRQRALQGAFIRSSGQLLVTRAVLGRGRVVQLALRQPGRRQTACGRGSESGQWNLQQRRRRRFAPVSPGHYPDRDCLRVAVGVLPHRRLGSVLDRPVDLQHAPRNALFFGVSFDTVPPLSRRSQWRSAWFRGGVDARHAPAPCLLDAVPDWDHHQSLLVLPERMDSQVHARPAEYGFTWPPAW